MLRKFGIIAVLSLIVAALAAVPALAANPHEVSSNPIVCTVVETNKGPAVECSGSIAGLGKGDVIIEVDAKLACETRKGNNQPGGHLQATSEPITPRQGRVNFDVTTKAAKCPPGLVPVVGDEAIVSVYRATATGEKGRLLFRTTVPITQQYDLTILLQGERPPCAVSLLFRVRTLALHSGTRSCSMPAWDAMPKVERASAKRPSLRIHLKDPKEVSPS